MPKYTLFYRQKNLDWKKNTEFEKESEILTGEDFQSWFLKDSQILRLIGLVHRKLHPSFLMFGKTDTGKKNKKFGKDKGINLRTRIFRYGTVQEKICEKKQGKKNRVATKYRPGTARSISPLSK